MFQLYMFTQQFFSVNANKNNICKLKGYRKKDYTPCFHIGLFDHIDYNYFSIN